MGIIKFVIIVASPCPISTEVLQGLKKTC